jgi:hypothetical protein
MAEKYANDFSTTLSSGVDNVTTSLPVAAPAPVALRGGSFRIRVDNELMVVTATGSSGASPWTVVRGAEGTTAASHSSSATVAHVLTRGSFLGLAGYPGTWRPADNGLLFATFDPVEDDGHATPSSGITNISKVWVAEDTTVTNFDLLIGTGGATLTAGSNRCGIYNASGTLICQTADQSSTWTSSGHKKMALTAEAGQSLTLPGDSYVFLAWQPMGTTRPTAPQQSAASNASANVGLVAADGYRVGYISPSTAGNPLPASFTPSSGLFQTSIMWWMGVS